MDRALAIDTLARTAFGEARGEGIEGMRAVCNVVLNRAKSGITWWGTDIPTVCRAPFQFSCWNKSDPNRAIITGNLDGNQIFDTCTQIAQQAVDGELDDNTNGATYYYARSMNQPPKWALGKTPCAKIGNQIFFKDID